MKQIIYKIFLFSLCIVLSLSSAVADNYITINREEPYNGILPEVDYYVSSDIRYAVDYNLLDTVASGYVGYLFQQNTGASQVIMSGNDTNYLFTHAYNGVNSPFGSIFVNSDIHGDIVTIYGRNRGKDKLFGTLQNYQLDQYYIDHPSFFVLTPKCDYRLDVFAGIKQAQSDELKIASSIPDFYANHYQNILANSFIKPNQEYLPHSNESIAMLVAQSYKTGKYRYVLYARKRPIQYTSNTVQYVHKMYMDNHISFNKIFNYKSLHNIVLYAQNDPLWARRIYESESSQKQRPFGDGGCGPTAIANAIANIVPKENLNKLKDFSRQKKGYSFCFCSVNEYKCSRNHIKYNISSNDEYFRYLPLVMASISTGNNAYGLIGRSEEYGSSLLYMNKLCSMLNIDLTRTDSITDTLEAIKNPDTVAIATVSRPFTQGSHYIVLLSSDSDNLYIIDSLRRSKYPLDKANVIKCITPGLIKVKKSDIARCGIKSIHILKYNK